MASDVFDHDAWQELRQAIRNDDSAAASALLSTKPEFVYLTPMGSCLHFAAAKGRLGIVRKLVELGADINLVLDLDGSPLDSAASNGHLRVVEYLIEQGASLAAP